MTIKQRVKESIIKGWLKDPEISTGIFELALAGAESRHKWNERPSDEEVQGELRRVAENRYSNFTRNTKRLVAVLGLATLTYGTFVYGAYKLQGYLQSHNQNISKIENIGENEK